MKYPMVEMKENILINASFLPNQKLVDLIELLQENEAIFQGEEVIAFAAKDTQNEIDFSDYKTDRI